MTEPDTYPLFRAGLDLGFIGSSKQALALHLLYLLSTDTANEKDRELARLLANHHHDLCDECLSPNPCQCWNDE